VICLAFPLATATVHLDGIVTRNRLFRPRAVTNPRTGFPPVQPAGYSDDSGVWPEGGVFAKGQTPHLTPTVPSAPPAKPCRQRRGAWDQRATRTAGRSMPPYGGNLEGGGQRVERASTRRDRSCFRRDLRAVVAGTKQRSFRSCASVCSEVSVCWAQGGPHARSQCP